MSILFSGGNEDHFCDNEFYSVDLSNATDRFPISVIRQILLGLLPEEYVDAWQRVMVSYPFDFKRPGSETKESFNNKYSKFKSFSNNLDFENLSSAFYSVGNPMGFLSS